MNLFFRNLLLTVFCVGAFFLVVSIAHAIGPSNAPDPDRDRNYTRKNGDLWVGYYGSSYRSRSSRLGSTYNRGYRGGGLHGGK